MGFFRPFKKRSAPDPRNFATGPASLSLAFSDIKKNPTVIAATNVIANSVSILPLNLYFKNPKDQSRQKALWHPLYRVVRRRPNSSDSPSLFMGKILRHILLFGNAYIYVDRAATGVQSLTLLNPEAVKESYRGRLVFFTYNGTTYSEDEILRISSLITDDLGKGYSPVELVRMAVLIGIQLDQFSLSSFGNGLNTKLLVDISEMLKDVESTEDAQKKIQTVADYLARTYTGPDNAGKPLIPLNGMKVTELEHQSSNKDAELLESRKWQETEICKGLGVSPWMVNGNYDIKYGNLEQAMTVYLNFTLSPYLRHIEQRFNAALLTEYEQDAYYFEFDYSSLLRPDEKSRAEFYYKLLRMGAISPEGICAKENLEPPAEGLNQHFIEANLMPYTKDVMDAYMAGAKLKAQELVSGKAQPDPARAAGDQAM